MPWDPRKCVLVALAAGIASCGSDSASERVPAGPSPPAPAPPPTTRPPADVPELGGAACGQLACLACGSGSACADTGPFLGDTCCAEGDGLVAVSRATGSEVVDLETDGTHVIACGGFGASISRISEPATPVLVGGAAARCQRIAFGELLPGEQRVFYLAHHGDTWVPTPFLASYLLAADGAVTQTAIVEDPGVSFEGMAAHLGRLYVAAHSGGVRVYRTRADGSLGELVGIVAGFTNAWKIAVDGQTAYVADADGGLRVVSLADPDVPVVVQSLSTLGASRDVASADGKVFVALGGGGVDVFDASDPRQLQYIGNIPGSGSAQAVDASNGKLAIASWNHVALRDSETFTLLATERTRPAFEQDLAVAMLENLLIVGEWEGLHLLRHRPGYVSADIQLTEDIFTLPSGEPSARSVVVKNRGLLQLEVSAIGIDDEAFELDVSSLSIPPGKSDFFQMTLATPKQTATTLTLVTNDPDPFQSELVRPIRVAESTRVDVGDPLPESFGFLDPSGGGQVDSLQGQVVLLAYFALF